MIGYLGIGAILFFIGIVFLTVVDCLEDCGWMLILCLFWPLSIFGLLAVGLGQLIKKVTGL